MRITRGVEGSRIASIKATLCRAADVLISRGQNGRYHSKPQPLLLTATRSSQAATIAPAQRIQISPYFFRPFPQVIRIVHSFCTSRRGFPIADNSGVPQSVDNEKRESFLRLLDELRQSQRQSPGTFQTACERGLVVQALRPPPHPVFEQDQAAGPRSGCRAVMKIMICCQLG
jgi:hypothetical protein